MHHPKSKIPSRGPDFGQKEDEEGALEEQGESEAAPSSWISSQKCLPENVDSPPRVWSEGQGWGGLIPALAPVWDGWEAGNGKVLGSSQLLRWPGMDGMWGMGRCWPHPVQSQCSMSVWTDSGPIWAIFPTFRSTQIFPPGASMSSLPLVSTQSSWTRDCASVPSHIPPESCWDRSVFPEPFGVGSGFPFPARSHRDRSVFPAAPGRPVPSRPGICLWDLSQPRVPTQGLSRGPAWLPELPWLWECRSCSGMGLGGVPPVPPAPSSVHPKQPCLNPCPSLECSRRVFPIFWPLACGFGGFGWFFLGLVCLEPAVRAVLLKAPGGRGQYGHRSVFLKIQAGQEADVGENI